MEFRKRLALLIENKKITPYKICKDTGISQQTIGRYLRADITPSGKFLMSLANYFNVSPEWLLTGMGEIRPGQSVYDLEAEEVPEIDDRLNASQRFVSVLDELKDKGERYNTVAAKIGLSPSLMTEVRKGRSHVTLKTLKRISETYGISLKWLTRGEGQKYEQKPQAAANMVAEPGIMYAATPRNAASDIVSIPAVAPYDRVAWMEKGMTPNQVKQQARGGVNYEKGCVMAVEGDLMEPTLVNGEEVFCEYVEPEKWRYVTGVVAVYFGDDMVVIKRIRDNNLTDGTLTLWSDNETGGKMTLSPQKDNIRRIYKVKYTTYKPIR